MKQGLALLLTLAFTCLCACAEKPPVPTGEPSVPTEPPSQTESAPVELPEVCTCYSELETAETVYAFSSSRPFAESYLSGTPESLYAVKNGELDEIATSAVNTEARTLEEVLGGAVQRISGEGETCLHWQESAYLCYSLTIENAALPGLVAPTGGILALEVHGDCSMDPGDPEWAALSGFDCVILSGDGTLRLVGGLEAGGKELPALILNGATLLCDNVQADGTLLLFAGTLGTALLGVQGDVCVLDGTVSATQIFDSEISNFVLRGGTVLLDEMNESSLQTLILAGGTTCLNGALPEGCTVEAGAGTLCARGLSSAQVNDYGGCVLRDVEADGTPFYSHLDLNEEQLAPFDASGVTQTRFLAVQAAPEIWLSGRLRLENAALDRLTPWSGLWLELCGESTLGGVEKLGAPALLLSGEGTLTAQNGLGLFAYEQYRTACLTLRGGTLRIPAGLEDGLYVGNASGADDLLLLEDGALISGSGAWLDHAAVRIDGGTLRFDTSFGLGSGSFTVNAGEVVLDDLFLAQGELVINGGTVTLNAVCLENGSITLNGGTLILPNGLESAVTENGSLIQNGGEIR